MAGTRFLTKKSWFHADHLVKKKNSEGVLFRRFIEGAKENKHLSNSCEQSVLEKSCAIASPWFFDEKVRVLRRPSSFFKNMNSEGVLFRFLIKYMKESKDLWNSYEQSSFEKSCTIVGTWFFDEKIMVSRRPSSLKKMKLRRSALQTLN